MSFPVTSFAIGGVGDEDAAIRDSGRDAEGRLEPGRFCSAEYESDPNSGRGGQVGVNQATEASAGWPTMESRPTRWDFRR